MRTLSKWISMGLTVAGVALAGTADANVFVHGAICQPNNANQIEEYGVNSLGVESQSTATGVSVTCPSPVAVDVGTSLQWNVRVDDNHPSQEVACFGVALDSNGNVLGTTAADGSGLSFTGADQLSYSFSVSVSSPFYSYASLCSIPAQVGSARSRIKNIRVF
jgi:hypothetical protein